MALKRADWVGLSAVLSTPVRLLGACVLGHSLRAFRHGVLRQLSGQQQTHGSLDFPAGDGRTLVVVGQS